jgi:hypothetical protein
MVSDLVDRVQRSNLPRVSAKPNFDQDRLNYITALPLRLKFSNRDIRFGL